MHVVVFAGGRGTRSGVPNKLLEPVAGKPWLDWKLEQLETAGATDVTLLVSFEAERFASYGLPMICDDGRGLPVANVPDDAWWTYGDVLIDVPLWTPDRPLVVVNDAPPHNLGRWNDAGIGFGRPPFRMWATGAESWHCNTPSDREAAGENLRRYGIVGRDRTLGHAPVGEWLHDEPDVVPPSWRDRPDGSCPRAGAAD